MYHVPDRESGRQFSNKTKNPFPAGQVKYLSLPKVPSEQADSSVSFEEMQHNVTPVSTISG